jgi:hypothetical protein
MKVSIDQPPGGPTRVTMEGVVDEHADFSALAGLTGPVEVNLRGIKRLNSVGIRFWIDAMRDLTRRARVSYVECSQPVIDQVNMIRGFLGGGAVRSFFAPMRCERCDLDQSVLVEIDQCDEHGRPPATRCPKCRTPMELDDIDDAYTLFIREPTVVR